MQGATGSLHGCRQRSSMQLTRIWSLINSTYLLHFFVGCIVNFIVSYLICMFQDSVPAGSYNDPFLSSVCVRFPWDCFLPFPIISSLFHSFHFFFFFLFCCSCFFIFFEHLGWKCQWRRGSYSTIISTNRLLREILATHNQGDPSPRQ